MNGPDPVLVFTFACFVICAALVALGFFLRRRGILRGRGPWLAWTMLCGLPLLVSAVHAWTDRLPAPVASPPTAGGDTGGAQPAG